MPADILRGTNIHPSGVTGVSVECALGMSVPDLAAAIPHGHIGVTTVRAIRQAGGNVVRTSGRSPYHATVTELTPEQLSHFLTPTVANPTRRV